MLREKSKLFLVLCLHRSGSSATAGVMHHLGIHMGDKLLPATEYNAKGHFEDSEFVTINEEILRAAKGSWYNPPVREKIKNLQFPTSKLQAFVAKHEKPVWGLKDPRTLLTYELWKPFLEEVADITYVFVHRPYEASIKSLARRDHSNLYRANQVLGTYLKNLYHYRHTFRLPIENIIDVYYEDMLADPVPFVKKFNEKIGNLPDHGILKVNEFLNKDLTNF